MYLNLSTVVVTFFNFSFFARLNAFNINNVCEPTYLISNTGINKTHRVIFKYAGFACIILIGRAAVILQPLSNDLHDRTLQSQAVMISLLDATAAAVPGSCNSL